MSLHLGLDLGGTNINCAVVDDALHVLATDTCPTDAAAGQDAVLARVATLGRATVAPYGEPASAGLALPGHFEAGAGVLLPNLLGDWVGRPIAGPGVVIGGRLHLGLGHAGEIGHTTVEPDGPFCGCGNRGCLDRVAGADAGESLLGPVAGAVGAALWVAESAAVPS